ncbi:MAG: hypothetical protein JKY52_13005 [Flavobacteriales bacterium]|nr:hypothetical protein [Flavobacteriales bacterium]
MFKTSALIIIQLLVVCQFAVSQKYFENFNIEDGLSQSQVYANYQDSRGYLWVGTYGGGVNRYDGHSFIHYATKDGLSNNLVYAIAEDDLGNLWFGTDGGGISVFNGHAFTTIDGDDGLDNEHVYTIVKGNSGEMWVGTDGGGLYAIWPSMASGDLQFKITHYGARQGLVSDSVISMVIDTDGDLWVGTAAGVSWISYDVSDSHDSIEITYTLNFLVGNGLRHEVVNAICEDHNGNIWFGTFGGGLNVLMKESWAGKIGVFDINRFTWHYVTAADGLCDNSVTSLYEDKKGYMWVGTYGGGACKVLSNSIGTSQNYITYGQGEGLNNEIIWSITQDRSGSLWLGTEGGGLFKYLGERFTHFSTDDKLSSNIVFSIMEDSRNNIWLGTFEGGVSLIRDGDDMTYGGLNIENYTTANGLTDNNVVKLFEDNKGKVWAGTFQGISIYDQNKAISHEEDAFVRLNLPILNNITVLSMTQTKSGTMWIGTDDAGAIYFDVNDVVLSQGEWTVDTAKISYVTTAEGLNSNVIWSITEDNRGYIWLGTSTGGVSKLIPVHGSTNEYTVHNITENEGLSNNFVLNIMQDAYGKMWFATYGGGISVLDDNEATGDVGERWHYITTDEGLTDDGMVSMVFDDEGNIWAGTNKGINKIVFDAEGNVGEIKRRNISAFRGYHIKQLGKREGFVGVECNQNSICKDNNGNIWFGTAHVLTRLNAKAEELNDLAPLTHIRGLRLFFDEVDWSIQDISPDDSEASQSDDKTGLPKVKKDELQGVAYSGYDPWSNLPKDLILPYNKNHLTFDFLGISLKKPENVKSVYMLEGLDLDWSPPVEEKFATYPKLPPGKYSFKVRTVNSDGIWNSTPNTYSFTITPPFWQTWWFYLTCGLLSAAAVYTGVLFRIQSLQRAKKLLKQQVKLRTRQLREEKILVEKQKVELEITNQDLNDAFNKLKQLETFKDSMMGMIVHDLKNPLNAIMSFSKYKPSPNIMSNIYRSGRKMLNMVMNILDIQKFEEAEMKLSSEHYMINGVLNEAIEQVVASADEKSLELINIVPKDLPVACDFDIVSRVLVNLLTNAVKFTPSGGKVTLNAEQSPDDPKMALIEVADTGEGIPKEKLATVFERFSQAEARDLGTTKSTGLGLTFCKLAVEAHGGIIGVKSEVGEGSTFYFRLPIGDTAKVAKSETSTQEDSSNHSTPKKETRPSDSADPVPETEVMEEAQPKRLTFTTDDKAYFVRYIEQFEALSVFHSSEINSLLKEMDDTEIECLIQWKEEMEMAMYNCNEKRWLELLNMVK